VNVILVWRFQFVACELIYIFVCKENTEIIMLKIFDSAVQNLVSRVTVPLEFVQPCRKSFLEVVLTQRVCVIMVVLNLFCCCCCNKYLTMQDVRDPPTDGLEMFV